MKSVLILFGFVLYIICMPTLFESIHDAQTDQYSQNFSEIDTGVGATSANVTLGKALWDDDTSRVVSISSNVSADSPSADTYNAVSKILTVGGLVSSSQRTITTTYDIDSVILDSFTGADVLLIVAVVFIIVVALGLIGGVLYQMGRDVGWF